VRERELGAAGPPGQQHRWQPGRKQDGYQQRLDPDQHGGHGDHPEHAAGETEQCGSDGERAGQGVLLYPLERCGEAGRLVGEQVGARRRVEQPVPDAL